MTDVQAQTLITLLQYVGFGGIVSIIVLIVYLARLGPAVKTLSKDVNGLGAKLRRVELALAKKGVDV